MALMPPVLSNERHNRAVFGGKRTVDGMPDLGRTGEGDAGDARIGGKRRSDFSVTQGRDAAR
jgi:hypothetical protein